MRQERRREEEEEEGAAAMTTDPVKHFRPIFFSSPNRSGRLAEYVGKHGVCASTRRTEGGGTEGRGFASFIGVPGNSPGAVHI